MTADDMCYHMSSKDEPSLSAAHTTGAPVVVPVSDVSPTARVRHFDQLDEDAQDALTAAVPNGRLDVDPESTRLSRGDVVVFTDYFLVQ